MDRSEDHHETTVNVICVERVHYEIPAFTGQYERSTRFYKLCVTVEEFSNPQCQECPTFQDFTETMYINLLIIPQLSLK